MEAQNITLESLIEVGNRIYKNNFTDHPGYSRDMVVLAAHTSFDNRIEYETWKNDVLRFLYKNLPNDISIQLFKEAVNEFDKKSSQKLFSKLLGIVISLKNIPDLLVIENNQKSIGTQINVTSTQHQSQNQTIEIFIDALDLSYKQVRELKEIVSQEDDDLEKAKPKILDKVISWGGDVAAGIVTNLLTNPTIWGGL